ncbi:MAG: ABC transporter ATP-binding protein [Alphaproteobacteria bacterium]
MLAAQGLTKLFGGVRGVDDASFTVERGRIVGLIGPNGAGKTTLFNLVAGAIRPTSGTLALEGRRLDGLPPERIFRHGIGRTFQIPRPFARMTVLENVMVGPIGQLGERFWANWLSPGRVRAQERRLRERAMHWLGFLRLDALADQPASSLSGGQRKLLELARVLMAEPALILLDEPAAGVNPALLDLIVDRIATLNRQGTTFLVIEHNMDVVMQLCDPVICMAQGRILVEGPAEVIRSDPRVIESYLGHAA